MKKIVITGASGRIAYALLFSIARGALFGKEESVSLSLYDIPGTERALEALTMELEDALCPALQEVRFGTDLYEQFSDIDLAVLIGAKPRSVGMNRVDLLKENGKIFVNQGRALAVVAKSDVKVLVVGNPCNTNCWLAMQAASSIPTKNFHALMRLDQNRSVALLAKKANVSVQQISRIAVWGNHSSSQVPDWEHVKIKGEAVSKHILDQHWLNNTFIEVVRQRGSRLIDLGGKSSAASAACGIVDALRDLYHPDPNKWFTSAVCSDGNPYGVVEGLVFGFPCRSLAEGNYEIVTDLSLSKGLLEKIHLSAQELVEERKLVQHLVHSAESECVVACQRTLKKKGRMRSVLF